MKRIRFSIRTLLVLTVVSAVAFVMYRRQTRIREVVKRFESYVVLELSACNKPSIKTFREIAKLKQLEWRR